MLSVLVNVGQHWLDWTVYNSSDVLTMVTLDSDVVAVFFVKLSLDSMMFTIVYIYQYVLQHSDVEMSLVGW